MAFAAAPALPTERDLAEPSVQAKQASEHASEHSSEHTNDTIEIEFTAEIEFTLGRAACD